MSSATNELEVLASQEYKYGFTTDVEAEAAPPGLSEEVITWISKAKKNEPDWLTEWRLKAYRHWLEMKEPPWPNVSYTPVDSQALSY